MVRCMGSPKVKPTRACCTGHRGECRARARGCQRGSRAKRVNATVSAQATAPGPGMCENRPFMGIGEKPVRPRPIWLT